ncbi:MULTISPECIES: hypothetical protein [unclassified Pseudomonas]|uniref:hypothetical protein n=1 Tax=unclassified Pseudomonas TaxID=196821 RepID=UPI0021C7F40F|nr:MULTISPECIES: hypothetical protein [unclassified Pseudomonas]MCU1732261.1 hypothetical protein [Pseudomonas sp. 20P_3.2_Bac4]MCU1745220.1 hypothetical protein [Pseudomonas sp. 20P_3.2_Bac5]
MLLPEMKKTLTAPVLLDFGGASHWLIALGYLFRNNAEKAIKPIENTEFLTAAIWRKSCWNSQTFRV